MQHDLLSRKWNIKCRSQSISTTRHEPSNTIFQYHPNFGISPTLFYCFASTFLESDNLLTISYADDFTVSCSNSNVDQVTETLTGHSSNIEDWADEQALAIR